MQKTSASGVTRASLVVHRRLRKSAGNGIAMPHGRGEIGCADSEKLLPWIEGVSVLCSEGASSRDAFDVGQQQATSGQRNDSLDIAQSQSWTSQGRQAGRDFSRRGHAERRKSECRSSYNRPARRRPSATGFPGAKRSPSTISRIATTPTMRTTYCAWPICAKKYPRPVKKSYAPRLRRRTDLAAGSSQWFRPAPALKPSSTLSLISFTRALNLNNQASTQRAATVKPARLAIWK